MKHKATHPWINEIKLNNIYFSRKLSQGPNASVAGMGVLAYEYTLLFQKIIIIPSLS